MISCDFATNSSDFVQFDFKMPSLFFLYVFFLSLKSVQSYRPARRWSVRLSTGLSCRAGSGFRFVKRTSRKTHPGTYGFCSRSFSPRLGIIS